MNVSVAAPEGYRPAKEVMDFASDFEQFFLTDDPMKAAENADVIITDTWASMGQEDEKEVRMKAFQGYQVNDALMEAARCWPPRSRAAWCSTACRHTEARRSQKRFLKRMQMKYLKRQKTAFTHRRPLWSC